MRIISALTALLSAAALPATSVASSASASGASSSTTTSIVLSVPASQQLPNPAALPASTHATLTTLRGSYRAPLTVANTFVFHNVTAGSYLADVHCAAYGFAPLRVDVLTAGDGSNDAVRSNVKVWETYRGNEWGNKGEQVLSQDGKFAVRSLGKKVFFQERGKFSILTILKNPMILMGLVSMGIFFGMPKLVENMDPEMRAEWEEQQKNNPISSIMGGGGQSSANPVGNFDMAAFMAGSNGKNGEESSSGNGGKKGGKK